MSRIIHRKLQSVKERVKEEVDQKSKPSGWVLPKEPSSFGDDTWTNKDLDVTPVERRTWTSLTILGFWISDAMSAQTWEAPSSVLSVGLTWREAVYSIIIGQLVAAIPVVLNGAMGASLHVPFPIAARSSFGFYLSRFAVVVRMVSALFWHAIQTYTGSTAMTQCIRAIWPSYLNIPNHIPSSVGITTQQMVSHLIFWSVQFPFLLTPPHKLKWFFTFKSVVVTVSSVAMVITMTVKAHGAGDIWDQGSTVRGSTKSWLILHCLSSTMGGWSTLGTNIADFTRYMKTDKGVYWQALFLPGISLVLGLFGIICTSAAKVVYGEYIWDPVSLIALWDGPSGRCGAFFVGLSWVVAQIGTNLSANVISCANDMASLCPKYINIRRGAIIVTITGSWIMVPWKIVHSAESLLTFMGGMAVFLVPVASILAADFWITKRRHIDVPALYQRHGRYRYNQAGTNWRAVAAFLVAVTPNLPGLAHAVNPKLHIGGAKYIYDVFYFWGLFSAFVSYSLLSALLPARETLLSASVLGDVAALDGVEGEEMQDPTAFEEALKGKANVEAEAVAV
ncbi:hypothetical protein A1O3_10125 [Capronia epimyces CBS 606.96]|uniref:NCS1 family nucleobase:cation symporter-1 n=1 Tax=Capronia epimyces CBS 606.96 TaxID=1182542 RepID=W9X9T0_9EURO|nr:uncharacterized protein A1O3_10125 [Capronia epimyces CBS 606.96]EXJ76968.1 hypothetical protein A1O3_10125 [Capronia epimyces CBS 606.96]